MKQKTLFIIASVCLLGAFILGALLYNAQKGELTPKLADGPSAALVRMHSPTLGKDDAPVVIVEFFDPACETCAAFYPMVKRLLADHPGKLRLVLRYAPFHPGSDQVVAALEAARKQGKFWLALEKLLATQALWAPNHAARIDLAWAQFDGLGLNPDQMRADMASPEVAAVIAQDLADAQTLKVTKTPDFFVNGRPLPRFGFEPLKGLVDAALSDAPR